MLKALGGGQEEKPQVAVLPVPNEPSPRGRGSMNGGTDGVFVAINTTGKQLFSLNYHHNVTSNHGLRYNTVNITSLDGEKTIDLTNSLIETDYFEDLFISNFICNFENSDFI